MLFCNMLDVKNFNTEKMNKYMLKNCLQTKVRISDRALPDRFSEIKELINKKIIYPHNGCVVYKSGSCHIVICESDLKYNQMINDVTIC
jgi:hypothetical protein